MTDEEEREGLGRTLRGGLVIVLVGVALGLGFNALGRASRPPRGLSWIRHEAKLPSLEDLQTGSNATPAGTNEPVAAPQQMTTKPAGATPAAVKPGAGNPEAAEPAVTQPAPAPASAPAQPPGSVPAAAPAVTPAAIVDLPVVPDRQEAIEVQLATVKKFFDAKAAVVVDAREAPEFAAGHIPGALSLPFDDVAAKPELLLPLKSAGKPIIVYCDGGDCEVSKSLAANMLAEGIHRVLVFTGGFQEWQAAGQPVARGGSR
jgi:rhodanese-related sulfurtransferase